jgi:hypothetical protein
MATMTFTAHERLFLAVAAIAILLVCLVVPYEAVHANGSTALLGYHFIGSPPALAEGVRARVDMHALGFEWTAAMAGVLMVFPWA